MLLHAVHFSCQETIGEPRNSWHLPVFPQVWPAGSLFHAGTETKQSTKGCEGRWKRVWREVWVLLGTTVNFPLIHVIQLRLWETWHLLLYYHLLILKTYFCPPCILPLQVPCLGPRTSSLRMILYCSWLCPLGSWDLLMSHPFSIESSICLRLSSSHCSTSINSSFRCVLCQSPPVQDIKFPLSCSYIKL